MRQSQCIAVLFLFCAVFSSGCATIVHGTSQKVAVNTDPPGAIVRVDGTGSYTTPAMIDLKRNRDYILTVSKDGYQTEQVMVSSVVSGWLAGNILFGGIIGGAVDAASGAAYRLVPETVGVTLRPLAPGEGATTVAATTVTPEARLRNLAKLRDEELITETEYEAMRKIILGEIEAPPS